MQLQERIRDRWQRIRAGLISSGAAIDTLEILYATELHDLHDRELQACALADEVWVTMRNEPLAQRVSEFATEVRARSARLHHLLLQSQASARERPDGVMHALVHHASEMAEVCGDDIRDVALVAALQRIIHCLSADYATLTLHAAAVGRVAEADQFAEYAESSRMIEGELNALARTVLIPPTHSAPPG